MEKGSFLVGLGRRRLSFPLTSPMMRRADSDDDEEMPANLANEKDNVGIVVTEETLVAQMARLRAHGLYSPVAQQIIPTPSTKRPSLLSRRASGPSPSRRGDEAEEEELAATTPSRLRRRRRLKLSSATPLRRRNRRRDTLLGSEGKDGGAPLAPQPPPSATAPSAADDPPEETSRETGVLEEVSAVTLLPEKESSRLDAQSIQRDALTSTLDGVGDSRSDVQEHAEEPVLEENVDESSQWPKVNRNPTRNTANFFENSSAAGAAHSRVPLDDGTHEAPALPEIPTVTRTPVVARMLSPKRTGLPPVVRSTVTSDSAQLSSQVLFAQPPPLPNALSASSHLETVPPSSSKRGAVADGHERRAPVFTGDTGSSTHGDDDVLADVEAAAFDASAAAREMHAIENQDVHEGSSQSTDQLVEIDEESTSPQGMISSNKAAQEENYVADDTLVISTSVTANPSLKSTVERAFCDAEVAALSAQACATVASASAHRSAENAYNRTCTFAVDRALSVAEDANSHAYSVSRNALNSSWKTISSKVADEAVATSKHAQDSAQGMAAYDTAQATSAGALPRDTSMISSSQLFTHPEAIEMTPQSRVDSHADAASQEVLEASEVLETVEQDFTSPQALAKSEQFQNLKSTSTGTETVDTASALVVETTAEDTHFPRSAIPLSELPASTSDPPDDSDVNEQESSRLMIKENDYFSKNSNEKSFAIGTRVRVNPIKQNGKVAEVTINGWRRIKLDNGNYSNHRPVDLDCLAEVAGAEELEGLHPTKEFRVESALELKFSQIVPGLRVGRRGDTRIGTVTDPPGIGGWAKVRFDGERSAASVRPSSLRIVLFESRESHANLGSYERKNDAAAKSRRIKSSSPMAMEKEKPARNPSLTSSHRRGVLSVGTRVAVLKKKRDVTRGCGTIVEVLLRGWLKIRFDGEEAVSNASFQTRMLEFLDTRQDRAIATRENPAEADRLDVDSPVEKKRANFQNSFQVGDIVAVARGNDVEKIGLHGVVNHIYRNGWRTVVLDGGVEEFPFRPWQLEAVATKEYGSAESHQSISASVHGEGAESSYSPATTEKPNWLHGRNRRVRFDVGERVTIIEDKKDAECIGKTGIVLRVSSKGWRRIRRLDTHEIRNYRSVNLHEAAAFEDTAPPALATDDSRNEGKKSPSAIPTRQVIIIGKNSKHFNKRGVLVAKKKGGWCQIFLDGGEEVHYRKEHIKEVGNQDRNGRVTNKQPKEHSHLSKKALGMQVGDRIRLKEKYHYKLTGAVDDDVLGFGTVSGIGTAGQHRVILDHATKDGTRSICVPRDRLKILDADFADDDVRSKSSSIQKVARPPPYQHINRMCFTASAKKVLSERAAKRSGMQRRICADDAEPPTCECISRRAWNVRIAKKLAERRRKQEPDKTGHVSNSRETVEDEDDEEDDPLLKRAKKRRSCAASDIESSQGAQDDFELVFENESEREFAIAEEKKKTIGVECDIDCLNRQLCVECAPSSCAHGERCKNRQFQRRQIKHVLVRKTPHCGWGLVCGEPVRRGEFIIEALGELVAKEEAEARLRAAEARGETNFYMIDCESSGNLVVDATRKGNESRFTNHSCDPSCELNKWRVGDTERYGLFAKRHLNVGEEITFNYRWKQAIWHHSLQSRPCNCGAKNCAGFFGAMSTSSSQQGSVSSSAKKPGALKRRRSREDVAERRYEGNYESTEDDRESKRSRADTENSELPLAAVSLSRRLADAVRTAKSILFSGNSDDLEDSTGLLWSKNQSSLRVVGLTKRLMREWTSTQGDQFGDDDDVVEPSPSNADADGTLSPTAVSDEESVHPVCSGPDGVSVVGLDSLASLSSGNVIFNEYFARRARKSEPKLLDNVRGRRLEDVKDLLGSVRIEGLRNAMLEIVDSVGPAVTASDDDGDDGDRHLRMMDDANDPSVPLVVGNSLSS